MAAVAGKRRLNVETLGQLDLESRISGASKPDIIGLIDNTLGLVIPDQRSK